MSWGAIVAKRKCVCYRTAACRPGLLMFHERAIANVSVGPSMPPRRQDLHLTIWNMGGYVEHYHHFLLGFFVPLIRYRKRTWQNAAYGQVVIRSCGPMDGLVRQLG